MKPACFISRHYLCRMGNLQTTLIVFSKESTNFACEMNGLNNEILRLGVPAVVSNVTVPLLSLCDTAIAGHLGNHAYLGAVAVGTMMINMIFWLLGFLRMGTSGLTAMAYGANDIPMQHRLLTQSVIIGTAMGLVLIVINEPLNRFLIMAMAPGPEVIPHAAMYFATVIWAAPATLATMSMLGWMLGMQNTVRPLIISVGVNLLNIILSLTLTFGFELGFKGVAWGTLLAQWTGLPLAWVLCKRFHPKQRLWSPLSALRRWNSWSRFFSVNTDLFFRSAFLMAVTAGMTAFSGRLGALTLAANAIMLQFFTFFSYFMDGLAFAAEAICGRLAGAGDIKKLVRAIRRFLIWGISVACVFFLIYQTGYKTIIALLTDNIPVQEVVCDYSIFLILIPPLSVAAFLFDGIYIGLTATRRMLLATASAAFIFFSIMMLLPLGGTQVTNSLLWTAFLSYLIVRGLTLGCSTPILIKSLTNDHHSQCKT